MPKCNNDNQQNILTQKTLAEEIHGILYQTKIDDLDEIIKQATQNTEWEKQHVLKNETYYKISLMMKDGHAIIIQDIKENALIYSIFTCPQSLNGKELQYKIRQLISHITESYGGSEIFSEKLKKIQ